MSTNAIFVTRFYDELKRRKGYRVAVAYVIAAGGIIPVASAVFNDPKLQELLQKHTRGTQSLWR